MMYQEVLSVVLLLKAVSIFYALATVSKNNAKDYLIKYGYIENNSLTDLETALVQFQERYNLIPDGLLNEETLEMMNRPRCKIPDKFVIAPSKWNKTRLRWYFPQADKDIPVRKITEMAFNYWAEKTNLEFIDVTTIIPKHPDISITMQNRKHSFRANCQGRANCPYYFDGEGGELAHAYFPEGNQCREIHLDLKENWYYGTKGPVPQGETSLLMTLVHEIGHSLGLGHSSDVTAIMYPLYQNDIIPLSEDDILAIQYLYGAKSQTAITNPTITISTTPKNEIVTKENVNRSKEIVEKSVGKNICEISGPDVMFLAYTPEFPNHRLYVIYKNTLWKYDINDKKIPSESEDLTNYLPKELQFVTHIFQNSMGKLNVNSGKTIYTVSFPSLNIEEENDMNLPNNSYINAVFQTNVGNVYIWYNNGSFNEYNEDYSKLITRGRTKDMFPGIPEDITSAFRYTDGNIYFFKRNIYYKYNEFSRKLIEAGEFNWNLFGILCPNNDILNNLKMLLSKIISFYE